MTQARAAVFEQTLQEFEKFFNSEVLTKSDALKNSEEKFRSLKSSIGTKIEKFNPNEKSLRELSEEAKNITAECKTWASLLPGLVKSLQAAPIKKMDQSFNELLKLTDLNLEENALKKKYNENFKNLNDVRVELAKAISLTKSQLEADVRKAIMSIEQVLLSIRNTNVSQHTIFSAQSRPSTSIPPVIRNTPGGIS